MLIQYVTGNGISAMPKYNISKINFHEVQSPNAQKSMRVDVSLSLTNDYSVTFTVPLLEFDILILDCSSEQSYLMLATATTDEILVEFKKDISVNVRELVNKLPQTLLATCS